MMIEEIKALLLEDHCDWVVNKDLVLKDTESEMKVVVLNPSRSVLLVNVPSHGKAHIGILANKSSYRKSCDKIMFVARNKNLDVYFIELKESLKLSKAGVPKAPCDQILYTTPVWDYLRAKLERHFAIDFQRMGIHVNLHHVVIGKRAAAKAGKQGVQSLAPSNVVYGGERFKVIVSSANIPFHHLK